MQYEFYNVDRGHKPITHNPLEQDKRHWKNFHNDVKTFSILSFNLVHAFRFAVYFSPIVTHNHKYKYCYASIVRRHEVWCGKYPPSLQNMFLRKYYFKHIQVMDTQIPIVFVFHDGRNNPFRTKTPKYLFPRGNEPLLHHQIGNRNFFKSLYSLQISNTWCFV